MGQLVRATPLALSSPVLEFLDEVVNDPMLERNWVELLSQLEFVGCRKMLRSLAWNDVNLKILKHIQEEAQHAYLLKQALGCEALDSWVQNPLGSAGWDYFSGLDESLALQRVVRPASFATVRNQSSVLQHLEVIGQPRLRCFDVRHEVAHAMLAIEKNLDDLEPGLIGERVKELR